MIGSSGSMIGSGGALASHASLGGKMRPKAVWLGVALIYVPPGTAIPGITAWPRGMLKPSGSRRAGTRMVVSGHAPAAGVPGRMDRFAPGTNTVAPRLLQAI